MEEITSRLKDIAATIGQAPDTTTSIEILDAVAGLAQENRDLKVANDSLRSSGSDVSEVAKKYEHEISEREEDLSMLHQTQHSLLEKL
jgi:hypothetical protein